MRKYRQIENTLERGFHNFQEEKTIRIKFEEAAYIARTPDPISTLSLKTKEIWMPLIRNNFSNVKL